MCQSVLRLFYSIVDFKLIWLIPLYASVFENIRIFLRFHCRLPIHSNFVLKMQQLIIHRWHKCKIKFSFCIGFTNVFLIVQPWPTWIWSDTDFWEEKGQVGYFLWGGGGLCWGSPLYSKREKMLGKDDTIIHLNYNNCKNRPTLTIEEVRLLPVKPSIQMGFHQLKE